MFDNRCNQPTHIGVVNGPSKNARLAKFKPNSRGLAVSNFYGGPSRSLGLAENVSVSPSRKVSHLPFDTPSYPT